MIASDQTRKHILFHAASAWGHFKPFLPLAMRILRSRDNVVISVLTSADIYSKFIAEVDKLPEELRQDAKARLHVIVIYGGPLQLMAPMLEFEPTFKAIYNGQTIKCLSSGKEYNLPPVTVAIIDPFCGYAVEAIREISNNQTPFLMWITSNAGTSLTFFREKPSGKLDLHTIRYGKEQDFRSRSHEFVEPVTGKVITGPGIATIYDYEMYPQQLPFSGNILVDLARTYVPSGQGILIVSSTSYDGESMDGHKEWFASLGKVAYPVGPSLLPETPSLAVTARQADIKPVVEFLDNMQRKHGEKSVIYISFGSFFWPTESKNIWAVIEELLASGTPLVLAHPSPLCVIPEDKMKMLQDSDIAFEIKWAPQEEILSHPATGWFISHGGWNSIQEAMHYGVPQIFWPVSADQPMNAATMTLVKKAGFELIEIRTGEYGRQKMYRFKDSDPKDLPTFTVEAVRREIRELMQKLKGEEGLMVRRNFEKMSREFMSGWDEGGEARESLEMFLRKFVD